MAIKPVEILIKAKDEASGILGVLQGKLTSIGLAIAGYFGISAFVGAVKGAADLEAKLSEVKAVSGATAAEMVLLRKTAEDAGATTKYTATEAADAMGNLARAGLSAKDTIAALPAVLQLAQAGGIDLGRAAEYITKTVMGMGLSFADAGRVADVLAQGANASNTSVDGLAQALSYAAPLAKTLGLSLETTVAIIGKFADAGIDASRAGTALNAIMAQFADPASKFRTELAGAGITTTNFEKALRQLAAAGPAGSKAINAVGTEAGPALRALLNQGMGALDDLKGKLDKSSGSAAELARIMNDNLNGAAAGLGSAWDAVKNALATPVLPVLKDGVTQLSAAFTEAVSNGTIGKFGTTIATSFENGIKWVKAFAAEVDFDVLATRMQGFATDTQAAFTKVGEYATNAGNIVKFAYGVMSAGVDAVLVVVYGLGEAFSGVVSNIQSGLALLLQGLAKITFGGVSESFRQAAAEVKLSAEATWAASEAFAAKGQKAFEGMAAGAETARDGWAGLTGDTAAASAQAAASAPMFKSMADNLAAVGDAAAGAGTKAKDSGDKQQAAAIAAKDKVAALRLEYEAAVATGNWQLATEKMQALAAAATAAKTGTADLKKQAEEDAAGIAASFERMGIKTKAELSTIATVAKQDFDRIKDSGQATTEGLQSAFKKYAEAAIAANGGVASEALKSEAAMRGLEIQTDSTGKSIVSAMGNGKKSTDDLAKSVGSANTMLEAHAAALEKIALRYTMSSNYTVRQIELLEKENALVDRRNQLERDRLNIDKDGMSTDSSGKRIDMGGDLTTLTGITAFLKSAGVADDAKARQIAREFADNQGNIAYASNPGQIKYGGTTMSQAVLKAAETYTFGAGNTGTGQTPSTIPQPAKTYTVNVNMGGTNTAINTSSDADAQALISLLQRAKLSA